jgi:hypothetical protein
MNYITSYNLSGLICYFIVKQKYNVKLNFNIENLDQPTLATNVYSDKLDREKIKIILNNLSDLKFENANVTSCEVPSRYLYDKFELNIPELEYLVKIDEALYNYTFCDLYKKGLLLQRLFFRDKDILLKLEKDFKLEIIKSDLIEEYSKAKSEYGLKVKNKMVNIVDNCTIIVQEFYDNSYHLFSKSDYYIQYNTRNKGLIFLNLKNDKLYGGVKQTNGEYFNVELKDAGELTNKILKWIS